MMGAPDKRANVAIKSICCGDEHTLLLSEDGLLWSWGNNWRGQVRTVDRFRGTGDVRRRYMSGARVRSSGTACLPSFRGDNLICGLIVICVCALFFVTNPTPLHITYVHTQSTTLNYTYFYIHVMDDSLGIVILGRVRALYRRIATLVDDIF